MSDFIFLNIEERFYSREADENLEYFENNSKEIALMIMLVDLAPR